jgi:hypothetical protein
MRCALSAEFLGLLRAIRSDLQNDLVGASSGLADLLRLLASSIDGATHRDIDMLASAGIALEYVGTILRDEALAVQQ